MVEPKIVWVDSWRDIPNEGRPKDDPVTSAVQATYNKSKNTIYAVKGKASEATIQHEMYHAIKRHGNKPVTAREWLNRELNAEMYAYKKISKNYHRKEYIRTLGSELQNTWGGTGSQVLQLMKYELGRRAVPPEWKEDYNSIVIDMYRRDKRSAPRYHLIKIKRKRSKEQRPQVMSR